ncbi:MipA/OmpV family protein [Sulfitobacter sp. D35]|uniref:MipA/OmpV family protein n=1 Tax=Sulfitobacter sp. D35 TaxID=3083252 RepID=UPI00296F601F|nr:MipA/OmpV family protein [Sulfitobacter sp. D35]MDW4498359.1 MipA/OmpV family protein [Sulfitobacter sp. D35]
MKLKAMLAALLLGGQAMAQTAVPLPERTPDYFGFGFGAGPRYIGSDDFTVAAVPIGRKHYGNRYVSLEANLLTVNVLDHPHWQAGPAGILRFGRLNPKEERIEELPEIDMSIDLGGFVGYRWGSTDPRDNWRVGAQVLHDVSGVHEGYVMDLSVRRFLPVGDYASLGIGLAASWGSDDYTSTYFGIDAAGAAASGLPAFDAGSGWRDARLLAVYIQPVSRNWALGAGMAYSYLLEDAGASPVTLSRDQFYAGIGVLRLW